MAWEPKDPWGKKGDSMDDVLRQARDQIRQFIPVKGVGTIILIVLVVIVAFNSFFLVGPREKGVVNGPRHGACLDRHAARGGPDCRYGISPGDTIAVARLIHTRTALVNHLLVSSISIYSHHRSDR